MKLTEISLAQPPRVKWSQDAKGEEYVNPAEVCGSFGWAQLHSWAENFNDQVCSKCGQHAIAFATAFHDVVNARRGVALKDPENLKRVAAMFGVAARGEMKVQQHFSRPTFVVEGKFTEARPPTILALAQHSVFYHGTSRTKAKIIQKEGLKKPEGVGARWFMLTTKRTVGVFFSLSDDAAVITFEIPQDKLDEYLWVKAASETSFGDVQYALRKTLPPEFITEVRNVEVQEWSAVHNQLMEIRQHQLGQHLRASTKELDVSSLRQGVGSPVIEKLTLKVPSTLQIKFRQVGEHVGVYGCEPIGASSDKDIKSCKLLAIAHPREEETLLLEEAAQAKVPVKGDLELDKGFGQKLKEAMAK